MSSVLRVSEPVQVGQEPKLDPSDPRVRKLVYSMYRDMLASRNDQANEILNKQDPRNVQHDLGVAPILETIIRQGSQTSSGSGSTPSTPAASSLQSGVPHQGNFGTPTMNNFGGENKGPPAAIFGAMTKDKKPFTYTPGGIDLSEIRSPRMARRIQRNAAAEGVQLPPQALNNSNGPPYNLPPASIAAMQPALPVSVLPPGGLYPSNLNRSVKPSDFTSSQNSALPKASNAPPPPPPPPIPSLTPDNRPPERPKSPNGPPLSLAAFMKEHIKPRPDLEEGGQQDPRDESPQIYRYEEKPYFPPSHPQVRVKQYQKLTPAQQGSASYAEKVQPVQQNAQNYQQPRAQVTQQFTLPVQQEQPEASSPIEQVQRPKTPLQFQQLQQQPKSPQFQQPQQQRPKSPQFQQPQQQRPKSPQFQPAQQQRPKTPQFQQQRPTTPQFQEPQNSYAPGNQAQPVQQFRQNPPQHQTKAQSVSQNIGSLYIPPIEQRPSVFSGRRQDSAQQNDSADESDNSDKEKTPAKTQTPQQTPQLNKAPTPWMNSQNRTQAQQKNASPVIRNTNTPWGQARVIPITFASNDKPEDRQEQFQPQQSESESHPRQMVQQRRVIPVYVQTNNAGPNMNGGERIIPIQIEGSPRTNDTAPGNTSAQRIVRATPTPQGHRSVASPQTNPSSPYSTKNVNSSLQNGEPLSAGIERSYDDDSVIDDPPQSKSFRVLQKIADDDDEEPSMQKSEPRLGNVPTRTFQTVRNNLPPTQGKQEHKPSFEFIPTSQQQPSSQPAVTQQYQFPVEYINSDNNNTRVPASQQKVSEPKMYMGKNIPSRSFKMLQQLTGEADALGSTIAGDLASNSLSCPGDFPSESVPPCPIVINVEYLSNDKCEDEMDDVRNCEEKVVDSESDGKLQTHYLVVPDDFNPNECNWDTDSYWYFWWYCASNFWNGSEYVFPEGWEKEYPMYFQYPEVRKPTVSIPSRAFQNLQRSFTPTSELEHGLTEESILESPSLSTNLRLSYCDRSTESLTKINETEESEVKSEERVEQAKAEQEMADEQTKEYESDASEVSCSNDSVTSSLSADGKMKESEGPNSTEAVVEEPESSVSESDDSSTLVGDDSRPSTANMGCVIEEYFSDDSESLLGKKKDRLSTIDELSENEKTLSNILSSICMKRDSVFDTAAEDNCHQELESDSSSSEEEDSHSSIIENASGNTMHYSSSAVKELSSDSSSSDDDEEDGLDELVEVTARLPLKLAFTKSKSFRDVTTVFVGESELKEQSHMEAREESKIQESGENLIPTEEVSFTLKLTKKSRTDNEECNNEALEKAIYSSEGAPETDDEKNDHDETDEVDFWSELMKGEASTEEILADKMTLPIEETTKEEGESIEESVDFEETSNKPSTNDNEVDFWSMLSSSGDASSEKQVATESEVNFWDRSENTFRKSNIWDTDRTFEFTPEYHLEHVVETPGQGDESVEKEKFMIEKSNKTCEDRCNESENETTSVTGDLPGFAVAGAPDEGSDESSSKGSSGETVIAREDKYDPELDTDTEAHVIVGSDNSNSVPETSDADGEKQGNSEEKEIEIMREIPIKCEEDVESSRNMEKIGKAENLLLRIEQFLEETFLFGGENDSGILTDMAKYMSDYETDNDAEGESNLKEPQQMITKSGSFNKAEKMLEKVESIVKDLENGVNLGCPKTAAERIALDYQRAKTHSRLFQLLQDECEKDGEEDLIEEEENEVDDGLETKHIQTATAQEKESPGVSIPVKIEQNSELSQTSRNLSEKRSRLLPLPLKSYLTSSLSIDSNSSQSSSSGVLSPMSPVNRDQILTDMINEFQQRHHQIISARFRYKKRHIRKFPSKIFQILQEEFGQEFYDAFDFGEEVFSSLPSSLPSGSIQNGYLHNVQNERTNERPGNSRQQKRQEICSTSVETNFLTTAVKKDSDISGIRFGTSSGDPKTKLGRDPRVPKARKY